MNFMVLMYLKWSDMKKIIIFYLTVFFYAGLFGQCPPSGDLQLQTQQQINDFQIDYPGCTQLSGYLQIDGITSSAITDLSPLSVITSVGGTLTIEDNDLLISTFGLHNLTEIGSIIIWENDALTSVDLTNNNSSFNSHVRINDNNSLSSINIGGSFSTIDGQHIIDNNPNLTTISGFNNFTTANDDVTALNLPNISNLNWLSSLTTSGPLSVVNCDQLTNLTGLSSLNSAHSFAVNSNDAMTSLSGLTSLNTVDWNLGIVNCPNLTNISQLSGVSGGLMGDLSINDNASLINLSGLNNITSIGDELYIASNASLSNLDALSSVTSVGDIGIHNNENLTDISGLLGITTITGFVNIQNNTSLTSLSGLDNIEPVGITAVTLSGNDVLDFCSVQSICDWIDLNPGSANISSNSTGCNNEPEVEAGCSSCITTNGGTTIEVTNTNDSGPGSLRNAIECANADPILDIINVTISGTIDIVSELPDITDQGIQINGNNIVIDGVNLVVDGLNLKADNITIDNVFVRNFEIGLILASDNLIVSNCEITDCSNIGISIAFGDEILIQNCEIFNNSNFGIYYTDSSIGTITSNEIYNNLYGIQLISSVSGLTITNNSIYCNDNYGISIPNGGNNGISKPSIIVSETDLISGTSVSNGTIEIFLVDQGCTDCEFTLGQGKDYLASVGADASGNWSWNPSGALNAGDVVTASVTDPNGNTSEFSACSEVVLPCPLYHAYIAGPFNVCEGESAELTFVIEDGTPGINYTVTWTNGTNETIQDGDTRTVFPVLGNNSFEIFSIVDNDGCPPNSIGAPLVININENPSVVIIPDPSSEICEGETVLLTASGIGGSGNYSYEWSTSEIGSNIMVSTEDMYMVTVTDDNSCTGISDINITVNPLPDFSFIQNDPYQICKGIFDSNDPQYIIEINNANLSGNESINWDLSNAPGLIGYEGDYHYIIDNEFSTLTMGQLCVNIIENNNCERQECIDIEIEDQPIIGSFTSSDIACGATVVDITVEYFTNSEINLYNCQDELIGSETGLGMTVFENVDITINNCFYAEIIDQTYFCSNVSDQLTIIPQDGTEVQLSGDNEICAGDPANIQVDNASDYNSFEWSTSEMTSDILVSPSSTTSYSVTATEANGCENIGTWQVEVTGDVTFNLSGELTFCEQGSTIISTPNIPDYQFEWLYQNMIMGSTNVLEINQAGEYTLTIDDGNCPSDTIFQIMEVEAPMISLINAQVNLCGEDNNLGDYEIDLNSLLSMDSDSGDWQQTEGMLIDANLPVVNTIGRSMGESFQFTYTTNNAMSPCQEAMATVTITVVDCNCPIVELNTDTLCNGSLTSLDLNTLINPNSNGLSGTWSSPVDGPNMTVPNGNLSNNNLNPSILPSGLYDLVFTFNEDPGENCPTEWTTTVLIEQQPVAETGMDGHVCNTSAGTGTAILNLYDLLDTGYTSGGVWSQIVGSPINIEMNGEVDFEGASIGDLYTFNYSISNVNICSPVSVDVNVIIDDCDCLYAGLMAPDTLCNEGSALLDLNSLLEPGADQGQWQVFFNALTIGVEPGDLFDPMREPGDYQICYNFVPEPSSSSCPQDTCVLLHIAEQKVGNLLNVNDIICNNDQDGNTNIYNFDSLVDASAPYDADGNWVQVGGPVSIDLSNPTMVSFDESNGVNLGDVFNFEYVVSSISPCEERRYPFALTVDCTNCDDLPVMTVPNFCNHEGTIDLRDFETKRSGGIWSSTSVTIVDNMIDLSNVNIGTHSLIYEVPDPQPAPCQNEVSVTIQIYEAILPIVSGNGYCNNSDSIHISIENQENFSDILWQTGETSSSIKLLPEGINQLDLMTTDLNGCDFLSTIPIYSTGYPGEDCMDANGFPGILDNECNCITDSECNMLCNDDFAFIEVGEITTINVLENDILPLDINWQVENISDNIIKVWDEKDEGDLDLEITEQFFDTLYVTYQVCKVDCSECAEGRLALMNEALKNVTQTNIITPNGDGSNETLRFTINDVIENSELWIYNRWGDRIFHMKDYDNSWSADGYPGGIYYYVFRVNGVDIRKTLTVVK